MLTPKIGDTVVIRGVVKRISDPFIYVETLGDVEQCMIKTSRIEEIIPAPPPKPVVGDMVTYPFCKMREGRRLLFTHGIDAIVEGIDSNTFTIDYNKLTKVNS